MKLSRSSKTVIALGVLVLLLVAGRRAMERERIERERQRVVVSDVRRLIEACKSVEGSPSIAIKGKALVWDIRSDALSNVQGKLPSELRAQVSDEMITVFMVMGERNVQVGTYSVSHEPAYRQYIDIAVAYWPEKTPVGVGSVVSKEPRSSRPVQYQPEYGDPNEPVANWIAALPRAK